jgi:glycogen debranching enzyme GlgX
MARPTSINCYYRATFGHGNVFADSLNKLNKHTAIVVQPGTPWPLGANHTAAGTNFAVFSKHAEKIEICFFDRDSEREIARVCLPTKTGDIWHGSISDIAPGAIYGIRAYGAYCPEQGHWFDSKNLLLDPYARAIYQTTQGAFLAELRSAQSDLNVATLTPKQSAHSRIIYELHVKGFSQLNTDLPENLRGTYAGLGHPTSIEYLKKLGVTSVSLLPVHCALDEPRLSKLGLSNYWGYNTLAFFVPSPKYASHSDPATDPTAEFKAMVQALHDADIEVLLDVVYNHTAESDEHGPTLSWRGLDNASYYRSPESAPPTFTNFAGCGNTLDIRQTAVLQLIMDSLRYWVMEMGIDGFRFDLAPVLGRQNGQQGDDFSANATFFQTIAQDPVLSRVTMIAEPWDIGPNGYQLGHFPSPWAEWNDQFRDTMRRFWLHNGQPSVTRAELATRLCGSADIFQNKQRTATASINYVVSHDGFTLADAVSYEQRHNEANGENNRDGHGHNFSTNCGIEGATDDPIILAQRSRLKRVLIASTLLSLGTPMLCAGDELSHTQQGNNNPYCQDNELTWIKWSDRDRELETFTAYVIRLRKQLQPLGRQWGDAALTWFNSDGTAMAETDWHNPNEHCITCAVKTPNMSALLLLNPSKEHRKFTLPEGQWTCLLNTVSDTGKSDPSLVHEHNADVPHSALMLLQKNE